MRLTRFHFVSIVAVLVSLFAGSVVQDSLAQGVSVAPLRILFDGRTRSATVFLSNRTPETAVYRISLVNRRMLETGAIVVAEEANSDEYFADELIRFSPRRVTIAPFGSQTIRLLVRRPRGDIPEDVEYRTHLAIRSIPQTPRLQDLEDLENKIEEGTLTVTAVATIETVIPILLRMGNPQATIEIANPVLELSETGTGRSMLMLDLLRGGKRSIYGELEVLHIAPNGEETQLHFARGLAVYYPTKKRTMPITLPKIDPQLLKSGQIRVRYIESEDMHGDQSAELIIPLGNEYVHTQ
jgi:P pilus assembly chaperone PapD